MRPLLVPLLLRQVGWPHLDRHRVRSALGVVGVALGVAGVVAIADASRSVLAAFHATVRTVAGDATLEVDGGAAGIDDAVAPRLAALAGVAAAAGMVEAT